MIIDSSIKNSIPVRNDFSSICPSAHHPALFLIQLGISDDASAVGIDRVNPITKITEITITILTFVKDKQLGSR